MFIPGFLHWIRGHRYTRRLSLRPISAARPRIDLCTKKPPRAWVKVKVFIPGQSYRLMWAPSCFWASCTINLSICQSSQSIINVNLETEKDNCDVIWENLPHNKNVRLKKKKLSQSLREFFNPTRHAVFNFLFYFFLLQLAFASTHIRNQKWLKSFNFRIFRNQTGFYTFFELLRA